MAFKMKNPFQQVKKEGLGPMENPPSPQDNDKFIEDKNDECRKKHGQGWYYDKKSKQCKKMDNKGYVTKK